MDNPKPDCTIDLSKVREVAMRDDHVTIDLNFDDGGMYSIQQRTVVFPMPPDGTLSSRVRWLEIEISRKIRKKLRRKKIVLDVSSKEDEEEDDRTRVLWIRTWTA